MSQELSKIRPLGHLGYTPAPESYLFSTTYNPLIDRYQSKAIQRTEQTDNGETDLGRFLRGLFSGRLPN